MPSLLSILPSDLARTRGGAERYAFEFHRALTGVLPSWEVRAVVADSAAARSHVPSGWTAVGGGRARHLSAGDAIGMPTALRELIRGPDVILCHQWRTRATAVLRLATPARRGTALVSMDHGAGTRYGYGLSWLPLPQADVGAHQSAFESSVSPVRARRNVLVRGGVDDRLFVAGDLARERGTDFLLVGRFVPYKGQLQFLEALPAGATASLIGPSDSVDPAYQARVRDAAAARRVSIRHDVSDAELVAAYQDARYTVQVPVDVRRYAGAAPPELLGLTMLEAMACGSVPICPSTGASAEFVRDGETGVTYEAGDVIALRAALGRAHAGGPSAELRGGVLAEATRWTWTAAAEELVGALGIEQP